jgi:hypothetical protein
VYPEAHPRSWLGALRPGRLTAYDLRLGAAKQLIAVRSSCRRGLALLAGAKQRLSERPCGALLWRSPLGDTERMSASPACDGPALYSCKACGPGELRVASQHLCCLRSSSSFDEDWSRTHDLSWLALRFEKLHPLATGLHSTLARLAASESFESPRSIAAVCALLHLSIETGVARRLSPGWRSRLASPAGSGPAVYLDLIGQKLRVTSPHCCSLRSPPPCGRDRSRHYGAPSRRLATWRCLESPRWLSPVCGSPPSFDRGWSHVAVLRSHSALRAGRASGSRTACGGLP